jgi:hypothetical protein
MAAPTKGINGGMRCELKVIQLLMVVEAKLSIHLSQLNSL